jgi:hypothetical protein
MSPISRRLEGGFILEEEEVEACDPFDRFPRLVRGLTQDSSVMRSDNQSLMNFKR